MNTGKYTLRDDFFWDSLSSFVDELEREQLDYAVVGGTAVQARIANILSKNGETSVDDIPGLELVIRGTGDFDTALDISNNDSLSKDDLTPFFSKINAISNYGDIISPKTMRLKKDGQSILVNCETNPEDFKGIPKHYYDIIKTSDRIKLKKGNRYLNICVPKAEYIVASKLTRAGEKDIIDVHNLLQCMYSKNKQFNLEEVRNVLKENNKENCFDSLLKINYELTK